jgi:hypothetical protein
MGVLLVGWRDVALGEQLVELLVGTLVVQMGVRLVEIMVGALVGDSVGLSEE